MNDLIFVCNNNIRLSCTSNIFKDLSSTLEGLNNYNVLSNVAKPVVISVYPPMYFRNWLQRRLECGGCSVLQRELQSTQG